MAAGSLDGYATGWFVVAFADELEVGGVKALKYFGQELVAFRGESGEVAVLDAFCPHLGAHLGVGSEVKGDTLECAFHAWCFDGSGACVAIPYAKKIPPKAKLRAWPVQERNGLIFVHHHPAGAPPQWEIPIIEEYGSPEWMPWDRSCLHVKTHPREIVENVADKAHFPKVHGTHVEQFENEYVQHMAIQRTGGVAYPRGGGEDRFSLTATYYGPGYQITEMDGVLKNRLLLAHTPVDEHSLDLRFGVSLKIVGDLERTQGFSRAYIDNLRTGFHEDIEIWEHKVWRERPVLCDGDGPIPKLRKWYRQFYLDGAD